MTVQYQEPGIGGEISIFSCMECGAKGNVLEIAYFDTLSITCTFACMYMVGSYSQGGGQFPARGEVNPHSPLNETLIFSFNGDYYELTV